MNVNGDAVEAVDELNDDCQLSKLAANGCPDAWLTKLTANRSTGSTVTINERENDLPQ